MGFDGPGCWQGSSVCSGVCVDFSKDPEHCGKCDQSCPSGEVCSLGACAKDCATGTVECGASCIDVTKDPEHCGQCDAACGAGQVCSASNCVSGCPSGTTSCGGGCVSLQTDTVHCGACGNNCVTGGCVGGKCQCGNGVIDGNESDLDCGGSCVDCAEGKACKSSTDCQTGLACAGGVCWRAPPSDADLVGYWRLEGDGNDSSPNGNNGTVTAATPVAGKVGQALTFTNGACVGVPDSASLDLVGASKFAFSAWIRVAGDCAPADHGIILNKEDHYEFGVQCAGSNLFREAIQLSDALWAWNGTGSVTLSVWQHVALTWDGATVRHYVNSAEVYTRSMSGVFSDRATGLGIGCRSVAATGSTAGAGAFFIGAIDEVAIYKRALTPSEIVAYYTATK